MLAVLLVVAAAAQPTPDPTITHGAWNEAFTQAQICDKNFLKKTYRRPALKAESTACVALYPASKPCDGKHVECDHLFPRELGGADPTTADPCQNFWPQPAPWFHAKDVCENRARQHVCSKKDMTLEQGRAIFEGDWVSACAGLK